MGKYVLKFVEVVAKVIVQFYFLNFCFLSRITITMRTNPVPTSFMDEIEWSDLDIAMAGVEDTI